MKKWMFVAMLVLALSQGGMPGILRLHVVANSDTDMDQQVKLRVRDAIITYMDEIENMTDEAEAEAYVNAHLGEIEAIAKEELQKAGFDYGVKAETGVYDFPEKTYADTTLPAGKYRALQVTLGKGEGQNWWCVLFPPLCYIELEQMDNEWKQEDGIKYKSLLGELFN